MGISCSHLKKIEDGSTNVGIATLQTICNALDIDLPDFFSDAYFKKTHTNELFSEINKLSDSERVAMLNVIGEVNKFKSVE